MDRGSPIKSQGAVYEQWVESFIVVSFDLDEGTPSQS